MMVRKFVFDYYDAVCWLEAGWRIGQLEGVGLGATGGAGMREVVFGGRVAVADMQRKVVWLTELSPGAPEAANSSLTAYLLSEEFVYDLFNLQKTG